MKFPLKHKVHDLTTDMRGQGKRAGGMIRGAMAARTGKSLEIDVRRTFDLSAEDAEEVGLLCDWDFRKYHKLRNDGLSHCAAIDCVYKDEEECHGTSDV